MGAASCLRRLQQTLYMKIAIRFKSTSRYEHMYCVAQRNLKSCSQKISAASQGDLVICSVMKAELAAMGYP
jgi:hypothetical protein